jgi:hypothetical protein
MDFELISLADFDSLPEDNEQCFVAFETVCRRNMTKMLDDSHSGDFAVSVRGQYMAAVYSAAQEFGFTNIPSPPRSDDQHFFEQYSDFALAVQAEVVRIRIRDRRALNALSVQLTDNTRTKIVWHVDRLRDIIETSDLDRARKGALESKLDELIAELGKRRVSLGQAMVVLSAVLVAVASVTTIGADGPAAITNVMKLFLADKETEEAALSRLAPPVRALPAPPEQPAAESPTKTPSWEPAGGDLDDEIPF